ncbi:hypothetical protein M409DRAFT_19858 [Zasmidium cellare ATCC 36951]|uniref:Uncharacterized protein n=1 Tax=Zasmidium cellare ATCC 36951 TaxID=1080233 RepID=A0A6A6CT63_ZASCE|nr:uncharacterized protein M409DRAFT_19858 [Zasmidium cellare ATCC 36951]KAF2170255.1 hypothetical protein M409DRAFT_19858 [Zasmidium cellare ATCC 36951]
MFIKSLLTTSVLACLVSATTPPKPKFEVIDANYDDIFVFPALPALNNLDTYEGLTYTDFDVNQVGVDGEAQLTGIRPHTTSNNIVSGIQALSKTDINPGFSTNGTDTKYFDLKYFYFGCAVNTLAGAEGVAQQCTINVRGYRKLHDANPVASAQFSFNPNIVDVLVDPKIATFDKSFSAIQRVEIVQIESTTGEALNVIVLDDVAYNLYK